MLVPLNITGATHKSRSPVLSNQVTRNLYPEVQENEAARGKYVLQSFPGLSLFGTASGVNRGMIYHAGVLFKLTGTTLYSVDSAGTHTSIGSIPGSARAIFAPIGSNLVIVVSGRAFQYTSAVAEILDADLESPDSAAHLNNQIIFDGDGGRFASSAVGDATDINGLDYATAESDADSLLRVYVHDQVLYLFGTNTTESWFNSGIGRPPFDRIQGGILQVGLAALHTVSSNARAMYWLGSDLHVYRIQSGQAQAITTFNDRRELQAYTPEEIAAAIGFCLEADGQSFYQLNLADKTYCFHEGSGQWVTLGESGARHFADGYARAFGKDLVIDYRNGNVYELDASTYAANGTTMTRERETGPLHGGIFGKPGREIEINRFELLMETGVGVNDEAPVVMLQVSPDGGRTWSTEMQGEIGREGEWLTKVEWGPLGAFDTCNFRIRVSDAVYVCIHEAAADVEVCI